MRAGLVVTGVLGLGTGMVFAFAALTAALFPSGPLITANPWGNLMVRNWVRGDVAIPVPAPVVIGPGDGAGGRVAPNQVKTLPGDIVVTDPGPDVDLAPAP